MYKYRAKKWCPKDLHPTKTSMGKVKRFFSFFCRCWSEAQERGKKVTVWSLCWKLTAKPRPLICPYQLHPCPTDHRLGLGFHPTHTEGRHTRAAHHHQAEFRNIKLSFDLLNSPETLWEWLQQGGQWWRTFTGRNRLWKRGLQCTYNAKDHSVGGKREPITSVLIYSPPQNAKENKYSSR